MDPLQSLPEAANPVLAPTCLNALYLGKRLAGNNQAASEGSKFILNASIPCNKEWPLAMLADSGFKRLICM